MKKREATLDIHFIMRYWTLITGSVCTERDALSLSLKKTEEMLKIAEAAIEKLENEGVRHNVTI